MGPAVTSSAVALVGTADEIALLPASDRSAMVTHALHESKDWLAVATQGTDPMPIKEFKAWAATIAEMTRQKGLAVEIQADALEMVRRAERGIGIAVRNGQEAGEIKTVADGGWPSPSSSQEEEEVGKKSVSDLVPNGAERTDAYVMAQAEEGLFEEVLTEAREESNLSRANVVRKIKAKRSPKRTRAQLADEIEELAAGGNRSAQIAHAVGLSEQTVRRTAREFGVDIAADRLIGKARRINPLRIARATVTTLDGLSATVDRVTDLTGLDHREAQQWTASLDQSIKALHRLNKKIKEAVQ